MLAPFLGQGFWGNIRRPLVLLAPFGLLLISGNSKALPFESKLLPAVLLLWRLYFHTITVTVLKFGRSHSITISRSITVTVLASAVTPSFPSILNYHLASHSN